MLWGAGGGNHANFYTSKNLLSWTKAGEYKADWFFECPDLYQLRLDGSSTRKWVLQDASGEYLVGTLSAQGVFVPDPGATLQRIDAATLNGAGGTFYASQVFNQMPDNRTVQMGWQALVGDATWRGNASFPAELELKTIEGAGVRVVRNPVKEISKIRTETQSWGSRTLTADPATDPLAGLTGDTYEIEAQFDLANVTASKFSFQLHGPGERGRTLTYDVAAKTFYGKPLRR